MTLATEIHNIEFELRKSLRTSKTPGQSAAIRVLFEEVSPEDRELVCAMIYQVMGIRNVGAVLAFEIVAKTLHAMKRGVTP